MVKVKIGTKFRYVFNDGRPEWVVKEARGKDTWLCRIDNDLDWAGQTKVFGGEEIRAAIQHESAVANLFKSDDQWWKSQRLGTTLHYHNGFGEFVRGKVVLNNGQKMLMPQALVGNWREADVVTRGADGVVRYGYHAKKIVGKVSWRPNCSCVWEYSRAAVRSAKGEIVDPAKLKPLSLKAPVITAAAKKGAAFEQLRKELADILQSTSDPREAITKVADAAKKAAVTARVREIAQTIK